ncbi:MAG: N-acetylmuramic acid 6-phosphate etherase [Candidatus Marinimicrobia bacterium]|nr:N-acetylmuramic acid 6-phosphate etherase [Candidatus Neomarinimicrobiota bacterium]|tara:strand:+ start:2633 stop:3535 length:903 start_codon:yes stop_codon:yes gene_type:complete
MDKIINMSKLSTEQQNIKSKDLDTKSVSNILKIINSEDNTVASSVYKVLPEIEKTIDIAINSIRKGNHVIYIGAGTSGRLGVLDASECPPTFSCPPKFFKAVIAGGDKALRNSVEGAEDKSENAIIDLDMAELISGDLVIGIASSGRTPYVIKGLNYAREQGCYTVLLTCNKYPIPTKVDIIIAVDVGQEILAGSTRMKSGTATKMILNMISTVTMIKLGKIYDNLMVDLKAVNNKLLDRGIRIITQITNLDYLSARDLLESAEKEVKTAIVMHKKQCNIVAARKLLSKHDGFLREVIVN